MCYECNFFWYGVILCCFLHRFIVFFSVFWGNKKAAIWYCRCKVLIYCRLVVSVVGIVAAGGRAAGAWSGSVVVGF